MLVLSRQLGERIRLDLSDVKPDPAGGPYVWITVTDIDRGKVRIGVAAPREVAIMRNELLPLGQQQEAART